MRRIGTTAVFARHESASPRSTRPRPRIPVGLLAVACALWLALPGTAVAATDALMGQQWALTQIGAPRGWASSTGASVLVGVVDTGVDLNHEDLAGRIAATTSCIGANADPSACSGTGQDDNGHGT